MDIFIVTLMDLWSGCEENKMTGGVTSSEDLKGSR